jgi:hypothetical protein
MRHFALRQRQFPDPPESHMWSLPGASAMTEPATDAAMHAAGKCLYLRAHAGLKHASQKCRKAPTLHAVEGTSH